MAIRPDQPASGPGLPVQDVGFLTEASHMAPMLAKRLADALEAANAGPREIYKQTGWFRDVDNKWTYKYGDQSFKLADTPIGRSPSTTGPAISPIEKSRPAMKGEPGSGVDRMPMLRLREDTPPIGQMDFSEIDPSFLFDRNLQADRPWMQFRPPTAGELFQHPMMFEASPELAKLPVENYSYLDPARQQRGSGFYMNREMSNDKPHIGRAVGTEGGLNDPESALTVALHELHHGEQDVYNRPYGGSTAEGGMEELGKDVMKRAKLLNDRRDREMLNLLKRGANKGDILGDVPGYPYEDYRRYVPLTDINSSTFAPGVKPYLASDPAYLGYLSQHGEAMARLGQRMATMPTTRMTGEPGVYTTIGGDVVPIEGFVPGPVEGDVHPFEALDIPPDMIFMRPQSKRKAGGAFEQGKFAPTARFDWLLRPWKGKK